MYSNSNSNNDSNSKFEIELGTAKRGGADDPIEGALIRLIPELRARALFLTQGGSGADDLVQDVLERAWLARARFQRGTNLRAWLNRIMRNLFIDGYRRRLADPGERRSSETAVAPEPEAPGPIDLLSMKDVAGALRSLPTTDQEIFRLAHLEHLSYQELSRRLGLSMNTVGTRLCRARKKLRRLLLRIHARRLCSSHP